MSMRAALASLLLAAFAGSALAAPVGAVVENPAFEASPSHAAEWRAFLTAQRAARIARLKAYAARGRFAMNTEGQGLAFVWRDAQGRLCAMADQVASSGRPDLVDRVATEDNALQLVNVTDGEMLEWMLRSGLTRGEIQLIQAPSMDVRSKLRASTRLMANRTAEAKRVALEVARKRAHIALVIERLELDTADSIDAAIAALGSRVESVPTI